MKRLFTEENTQLANKHMNKCSALLANKKMQIKTTRDHCRLIRMVDFFLNTITLNANKDTKTGSLTHCW